MTNINNLRITEKNNTRFLINEKKGFIKQKKDTVRRLREQNTNSFHVSKVKDNIKQLEEDVKILEKKLINIESGSLDEELINNVKKNSKIMKFKSKKPIAKKIQQETKPKPKINYSGYRQPNKKQLFYATKYFFKVEKSIPDYLKDKLNKMPNNKGYIFRGVHLYGNKKPDRNNKLIMYETKHQIKYTHIWDYDTNKFTLLKKNKSDRKSTVVRENYFKRKLRM